MAGAAAARSCAARAARRRGSSVLATSWARLRPRSRKSGAGPRRSPVPSSPALSSSAPSFELVGEEARDVVPGCQLERARVRLEGLHEHAAGRVAAAAAGELRDELEGALLGTQVREPEPGIGVDDGGQRDTGEVVALRDHLRAEQDGAIGVAEAP